VKQKLVSSSMNDYYYAQITAKLNALLL